MQNNATQNNTPVMPNNSQNKLKKAGAILLIILLFLIFWAGVYYIYIQFIQQRETSDLTIIENQENGSVDQQADKDEEDDQGADEQIREPTDTVIDLSELNQLTSDFESEVDTFIQVEESVSQIDSGSELNDALEELDNFSFD